MSENVKKIEKELGKVTKKKVTRIKDLELQDGEIYCGRLTAEDKYQLLVRHLNNMSQLLNLIATFESQQTIILQKMAKEQGIDITK